MGAGVVLDEQAHGTTRAWGIGGLMVKQIARLLDVPLWTVLARLHRGRRRFEQELGAYAQETGLLLKGAVRRPNTRP